MLKRMRLVNFRSILEQDVSFGQLTVLVGANGSGKSNLIKALALIGAIPVDGVVSAVAAQGGFEAIIPKKYSAEDAKVREVQVEYSISLPPPRRYPDHAPEITVDHAITLSASSANVVSVSGENLVFHQVLEVGKALSIASTDMPDEQSVKVEADQSDVTPSSVTIQRNASTGKRDILFSPAPHGRISEYLAWLGLGFAQEETTDERFSELLAFVVRSESETERGSERESTSDQRERQSGRSESFLESGMLLLSIAPAVRMFMTQLKQVRRYELLASDLREAQRPESSWMLAPSGRNMPRAVRGVLQDEETVHRILDTLSMIAPHVARLGTAWLETTGMEFVQFAETGSERRVASWESADGTLRALAILLALETHPTGGMILIEEPEQNLHPWAVRALMEHIRDTIHRKNLQVVITTHSEHVLGKLAPEELLVATRSESEGTRFLPISQILPNADIEMGEVGQLWSKGLLMGVPSYGA